jgi:hypothetical protein
MTRPGQVVGRCEVCRLVVVVQAATRVLDRAVLGSTGRPVRRLAHRGDCALELEHRVGGVR